MLQTIAKLRVSLSLLACCGFLAASLSFGGNDLQAIDQTKGKPTESKASPAAKKPAAQDAAAKKLVRNRRIVPKKKGEISFDDILFEIKEGEKYSPKLITKEIRDLEEKTVKIRGFILPVSVFQQTGIKQFVLVRDNQECCFGPGAALYDCIMIKMTGSNTATFSTRPVAVKGKFRVTEDYKFDDKYLAIYEMEATLVE